MNEEILTVKELAELLRISEATLYKLIRNHEIPVFKVANEWRFQKKSITKWITSKEVRIVK